MAVLALCLLLAVILSAAGTLSLSVLLTYSLVAVPDALFSGRSPYPWFAPGLWQWLAAVAVCVAFLLFLYMTVGFDFAADVASYISNSERRDRLHQVLRHVISRLDEAAPNAQIVVVGHSLGSVFVSHAVSRPPFLRIGSVGASSDGVATPCLQFGASGNFTRRRDRAG